MTIQTASLNVAGGRGLPVPLEPVPHARTRPAPWKPAYWSAPPPEPVEQPVERTVIPAGRATSARRKTTARRSPRPAPRVRFTHEQVQQIADRYAAGTRLDHLAAEHRVSWQKIKETIEQAGGTVRPSGGGHRKGTLTPEQLAEAVCRYQAGEGVESVAADLPVYKDRLAVLLREAGVTIRPPGGPGRRARRART